LLADRVQVVTLVLPEVELFCRIGVHSVLESVLWVLLQDMLDLSAPLHDGVYKKGVRYNDSGLTFQDERLVFGRGLLGGGDITWGKREDSAAFDETDGHDGVRKEAVELVHKVLRYKVTPADLVKGVA
jgi:hypothetical protein